MAGTRDSQFNLPVEKVEKEFREPYITTGYRKPRMSSSDCLKSVFLPNCNECFNVWSHAIYGVYFCVKYWNVFSVEFDVRDPYIWPLFTFAMGMILFCFMSSIAHTFNSMSPYLRHKCFYLDYAAISIYGMGVNLAFFYYARPLDVPSLLFKSPYTFLTIALLNSLIGTYLCCMSRTRWSRFRYVIRTSVYTNTFLIASTTIVYRYLYCTSEEDCDKRSFPLYWNHAFFLMSAAIAYVSKVPERFCTKTFDCIGSSHNFMHIFTCVGADLKFEFIKSELVNRKSRLFSDAIQSNVYSSLLLMTSAFVLNLLICYLVEPDQTETLEETRKED